MPATYHAPVKDTLFVMKHIVGLERYANLPGFADATPDLVQSILEEAGKFAEGVVQPTNQIGDREGCTRHADGSVTTPPGFKEAYRAYVEGGWGTLSADPAYGGQGLPHVIASAVIEYLTSANIAFSMYPGLTHGAASAIDVAGSDEQKARYLPKMTTGEWTGTMNLTEPQCGTDLGLIRSRAVPNGDGSHAITGTKIFISSGEHDLADNIIHLVLAKTPGAPDTVKGISLFIVPKFIVNDDGSLGARNAVTCGSIEHKMGIHANSTCVMNYDGATGWMVGPEFKGLRAMFIMMNVARLGVGQQGLALGEVAYQNAAAYAKDRIQGRALTGPASPDAKADSILVHPDVRRMLLDARAFNEGARALCLWGALQSDLAHCAATPEEREAADDVLGLLTPVIKSHLTDRGYAHATNAQQVFGGHGYVEEWGMSQFVRDARIAMIYEGTNGVQAMDLVGRKLGQNGGRGLRAFLGLVANVVADAKADPRTAAMAATLESTAAHLQDGTLWLLQNASANPDEAGAGASSYLDLMALAAFGMLWLQMARAANAMIDDGDQDCGWYEAKVLVAQHYYERAMPEAATLIARLKAGSRTMMAMPANAF
jgi:alkylation response protein AidB-like acyl-CoA dehydrogenase